MRYHRAVTARPGFYRRPLPAELVPFASPAGRALFREALAAGDLEGWFALAEQFHTQADPAFCGLGTLVVALNALEIDPGRIWKGPWRWYGEELLDCCLPLEQVRAKGLTLDELACLARCNGAATQVVRAADAGVDPLRAAVRRAATAPRGPIVAASYARRALGQTGEGHFSPIGGYHAGRDLALVLDVARFKYPPHWVPLADLHRAMLEVDPATGKSRGWVALSRGAAPAALFFRVAVDGRIDDLARLLAEPGGGAAELGGWLRELDLRFGDHLLGWLSVDQVDGLAAEHRGAVEALLCELRATAAFAAAAAAVPQAPALRGEALAILLLALPDAVIDALPPAAAAAAHAARGLPAGSALAVEAAAVREQLGMLERWRGRAA
jgi:glutathione gamma-glutamylcysteinyltransferase